MEEEDLMTTLRRIRRRRLRTGDTPMLRASEIELRFRLKEERLQTSKENVRPNSNVMFVSGRAVGGCGGGH